MRQLIVFEEPQWHRRCEAGRDKYSKLIPSTSQDISVCPYSQGIETFTAGKTTYLGYALCCPRHSQHIPFLSIDLKVLLRCITWSPISDSTIELLLPSKHISR